MRYGKEKNKNAHLVSPQNLARTLAERFVRFVTATENLRVDLCAEGKASTMRRDGRRKEESAPRD
jgi:hypothetical protein